MAQWHCSIQQGYKNTCF